MERVNFLQVVKNYCGIQLLGMDGGIVICVPEATRR